MWVQAVGDASVNKTIYSNLNVALAPEEETVLSFNIRVPGGAPLQGYTLTAHIGDLGTNSLDSDQFRTTVEP